MHDGRCAQKKRADPVMAFERRRGPPEMSLRARMAHMNSGARQQRTGFRQGLGQQPQGRVNPPPAFGFGGGLVGTKVAAAAAAGGSAVMFGPRQASAGGSGSAVMFGRRRQRGGAVPSLSATLPAIGAAGPHLATRLNMTDRASRRRSGGHLGAPFAAAAAAAAAEQAPVAARAPVLRHPPPQRLDRPTLFQPAAEQQRALAPAPAVPPAPSALDEDDASSPADSAPSSPRSTAGSDRSPFSVDVRRKALGLGRQPRVAVQRDRVQTRLELTATAEESAGTTLAIELTRGECGPESGSSSKLELTPESGAALQFLSRKGAISGVLRIGGPSGGSVDFHVGECKSSKLVVRDATLPP